jgi:hypothetical protein
MRLAERKSGGFSGGFSRSSFWSTLRPLALKLSGRGGGVLAFLRNYGGRRGMLGYFRGREAGRQCR